ncbi:MAG: hypothetical protein IRZ28_20360 [Steroidobacteraceae bacterium]|nr:hypothetical protein [Steroidobacteraceae bacterium]
MGRFEGDTLVIRTVGLIDTTVMDARGLPHSDQLVITERLRVLPDGRLENRMTFEDPETFTRPWETVLTFHRDPSARVTTTCARIGWPPANRPSACRTRAPPPQRHRLPPARPPRRRRRPRRALRPPRRAWLACGSRSSWA